MSQKRLLIIGPQGSGKGTQAEKLVETYHIVHISTGNIFREEMSKKTELGKELQTYVDAGHLVPDTLTVSIVAQRLEQDDCKNGFLFDGFPRNIVQAKALDQLLTNLSIPFTHVICLDLAREKVKERLVNRRTCSVCGRVYHLINKPPKVMGVCDYDGETLIHRADDMPEKIEQRLNDYYTQTEPIIEYYAQKDLVTHIDADQEIDRVFDQIVEVLET